jgi:prepilin-type N-terminal cleavage/methylation domain-containing protein
MMRMRSQGFTLIETLITIAILTTIAAIALPNLTSALENSRIRGASDHITNLLYFAKSEAIRQNKTVYINFASSCIGIKAGTTTCDCTVATTSSSSYCSTRRLDVATIGISGGSLTPSATTLTISPIRGIVAAPIAGESLPATVTLTSARGTSATIGINMLGRFSSCTSSTQPIPGIATC